MNRLDEEPVLKTDGLKYDLGIRVPPLPLMTPLEQQMLELQEAIFQLKAEMLLGVYKVFIKIGLFK